MIAPVSRVPLRAAAGAGVVVSVLAVDPLLRRLVRGSAAEVTTRASEPDVILLILDTVRAANMSLYGYSRQTTPRIDALASHGVVFENAFSVAPWSAPSHASMFTGLWGGETGADYTTPMHREHPTLAEVLSGRGYRTGAFMGNAIYAGRGSRLDRGFHRFDDYLPSLGQAIAATTLGRVGSAQLFSRGLRERKLFMLINAFRYPDFRVRRARPFQSRTREVIPRFMEWRDSRAGGDRPYFAVLNFWEAHEPYAPPDPFARLFDGGRTKVDRYDGAIAYLDSAVGALVDEIRARGAEDRTVVIVTSDHGELFGEHALEGHGNAAYLPVVHVPLMMWGPGIPRGVRVGREVSLRDLAATVLDLSGAGHGALPGASLRNVWNGGQGIVSPVVIEASKLPNASGENLAREGAIRSVIDSAWHYIRYYDGREEIFDWRADRAELYDLIATSGGRAAAERLRHVLTRELDRRASR